MIPVNPNKPSTYIKFPNQSKSYSLVNLLKCCLFSLSLLSFPMGSQTPQLKPIKLSEAVSIYSPSQISNLENKLKNIPDLPLGFSSFPKIPKQDRLRIQDKQAEKWIGSHCTERGKFLARKVTELITESISHNEFEKGLAETTEQLNSYLRKKGSPPYVLIYQPKKSNEWVAKLAIKYLSYLPERIICLDATETLEKYISENKEKNLEIVNFDDATYSGLQVNEFTNQIKESCIHAKKKTITWVIPFCTSPAKIILQENHPDVNLFCERDLPLTSDHLPLDDPAFNYQIGFRSTFRYFAHKIADSLSWCCNSMAVYGEQLRELEENQIIYCNHYFSRISFLNRPSSPYAKS